MSGGSRVSMSLMDSLEASGKTNLVIYTPNNYSEYIMHTLRTYSMESALASILNIPGTRYSYTLSKSCKLSKGASKAC